jgi:protein-tyrosine phosphatase
LFESELQKVLSLFDEQVAACSEYTRKCGSFSNPVNGTTMDGLSSAPDNVTLLCRYDNISRTSIVSVTWAPPERPNGLVVRYNVYLDGSATFKNEKGVMEKVAWEPKVS